MTQTDIRDELSPTILFVSDQQHTRAAAADALMDAGYSVATALDASDAPDVFARTRADFVVLAGSDAADTARACERLRSANSAVPILIAADLDNQELIDEGYRVGATDFITAPLRFSLLVRRLKYLIRSDQTQQNLRSTVEHLSAAQRIAGLGYWLWDQSKDQVSLSAEAARILGRASEAITLSWDSFLEDVHDEDRHRIRRAISELQPSETTLRVEHRLATDDATVCQEVQATQDPYGDLQVLGTIQDISERKRAERHIIRLAYHDDLTGLPNRTFLWDSLNDLVNDIHQSEQRLALIAVHLDSLYRIVDTFGHEAGDHLLKMVAERLDNVPEDTGTLVPEDTLSLDDTQQRAALLARVGNEGFMFVFADVDSEDNVWQRARRIQEVLTEPVEVAGHAVVPSACLGLALYPDHGRTAALLLKNVETAQHQAIASGPGHAVLYTESLHASARERLTLEVALRRAMDTEALELHYQPKVDATSGLPVGMEALLRWEDPELGSVSPGRFIRVAEEAGLIVPLGGWVLRTACAQTLQWRMDGFADLRVAVNISAEQFVQPDFVHVVRQTLTETGLPPEGLELEITESLLMRDTSLAVRHLTELRSLGIHIALDDFGTGYSSLSYLHRFPLDSLKIDRSFVIDMIDKPESATIVRAIIVLSHNLNLRVVAEGVETVEQLEALRKLGCEEIQGYFYSPALPGTNFESWIRTAFGLQSAVGQ